MPISKVGVRRLLPANLAVKGFSLIEALLVMVILGLLVAVVTPVFTSGYRSIVLKSTVRSAAATLRYVRATAIGAREKRSLAFDLHKKEFSPDQTADKSTQPQSVAEYIDLYEPHASPTDVENATQPVVFEFLPSGGSNGGSIVFAYHHKRYLIDVSPLTGKVKVSRSVETALAQKPQDSSQ